MGGTRNVHISAMILIALLLLSGALAGQDMQALAYVSGFGFLSLLTILLIIASPIMHRLRPCKFTAYVLANRQWIGIYSFVFASMHVFVVMNSFFMWDVAAALGEPYRLLGGVAFLILAALTATSNRLSMRKLGRNWKRLHYTVYIALVLIVVHSSGIGQLFVRDTAIKAIVIIAAAVLIAWKLHMKRRRKPAQPVQNAPTEKQS